MNRDILAASAIAATAAIAGCESDGIGACGTYSDTPGTAVVTAVQPAPPGESSCPNDPVKITFDFTPDDPALSGAAVTGWAFTINAGMNPPSVAVGPCGLGAGSSHAALRRDAHGGSCPPVVVTLSDLGGAECQAALAACF